MKVFLPRLSFLECRFRHEPRRLFSSVLLFEQEQVPLVHQRRHLSSLLNSSSHPRIMNAHHAGTNGEKEKRKRLRSQTRALCCVRAWKARISLSRNGFLLGEEKRLENSEGKYSSYSAYLIIFHCLVVRKRKRQKMHLLPKPIWNLTLTVEQQQTRARKCRKRCERDFDFYTYFKPLDV